jgi:hypothetical protein
MRIYKSFLEALGKSRLPWAQEVLAQGMFKVAEIIDDQIRGAEAVAEKVRKTATNLGLQRQKLAAKASDQAVQDGLLLWKLWCHRELVPWAEIVARCGISRSTARNLMNLAAFSKAHPQLYGKLRTLGPTKLYRLCRRPEEALKALDLEEEVQTERGKNILAHLSDRELAAYLRKEVLKVQGPPLVDRARAAMHGLHRMIENAPSPERAAMGSWQDMVDLIHREADWLAGWIMQTG